MFPTKYKLRTDNWNVTFNTESNLLNYSFIYLLWKFNQRTEFQPSNLWRGGESCKIHILKHMGILESVYPTNEL